ncbi:MAG: cell division ATP-binding protein FtsE [Terrabacter sp.]
MILFENVTKTYPRTTRPALEDVSLEIPRGEFAFVVGTSGSGKSTLMQLVMKEQDATRGRILVAGRDLDRLPERKVPALRREIGCVFQDFRLLPNKTVFQNVAYALQVLGSSRARIRQTVPETLELVGLAGMEKRLPHQLSGGEQQRVAIARAFVNRPPVLLADEPTGNLDPDTSLGIVQLLDRINRTGTTVVMATHDTVTVNAMRKRVIRLDRGVLVSDMEAGDYTTGSIPRIRLDDDPGGAPRPLGATPDIPDGYDDADPTAYGDGDGPVENDPGALPPIGRDADEPRPRGGIFKRHKAVQTSDR